MKRSFFTGLALLIPFVITLWVINFLIHILTAPFLWAVEGILKSYNLPQTYFFLTSDAALTFWSRIIILMLIFGIAILCGFLAKSYFMKYLFNYGDYVMHRIPLVNRIYKSIQDVIRTVFKKEKKTFSQVVLIPFPHAKAYGIGMLSSLPNEQDDSNFQKNVSLFLLGTPNPTMGFMLNLKKENLLYLDMKTDEAWKFILSFGLTQTEIRIVD